MDGTDDIPTPQPEDRFDVVIVGASLAGCSAAIMFAQSGHSVALVDKITDPGAFKHLCGHYIQASALPALRRLGLLEAIEAHGAVRSPMRIWTPWGCVDSTGSERIEPGVNIRRETLDPILRHAAADHPRITLTLDRAVTRLLSEDGSVTGVVLADRAGAEHRLHAKLVVGADGRNSAVAKLASLEQTAMANGRFSYGAYFSGPSVPSAPACMLWVLDPEWAGAFPTDGGLTLYACMPRLERAGEFRSDPDRALVDFMRSLPTPPPIDASQRVGKTFGSLQIPVITRQTTASGLALVGDAAFAADPMFAVGCSWAIQSAEWLVDAVSPSLSGDRSLKAGLRAYRRRRRRETAAHALVMRRLSTTRPLNARARLVFASAATDASLAARVEEFSARCATPQRFFVSAVPRAVAIGGRSRTSRRPRPTTAQLPS